VVAELVEVVDVQPRLQRIEVRAHLLGEDLVPQLLRGDHFLVPVGDEEGVARRVCRKLGTGLISADEEL
jgi:hypothetical protein